MALLSKKLDGSWTFSQGLLVLTSAVGLYTSLSIGHLEVVKATIGVKAYLGDGPRMPPHFLIINQLIKALALMAVVWLIALRKYNLRWDALGFRPCAKRWLWIAPLVATFGFGLSIVLAKLGRRLIKG